MPRCAKRKRKPADLFADSIGYQTFADLYYRTARREPPIRPAIPAGYTMLSTGSTGFPQTAFRYNPQPWRGEPLFAVIEEGIQETEE